MEELDIDQGPPMSVVGYYTTNDPNVRARFDGVAWYLSIHHQTFDVGDERMTYLKSWRMDVRKVTYTGHFELGATYDVDISIPNVGTFYSKAIIASIGVTDGGHLSLEGAAKIERYH